RDTQFIQLRDQMAGEVAAGRLTRGADRPRAGVVRAHERVDPLNVAEGDGLVVAAGRKFQRRLAIAEQVVHGRYSRNERLEVRSPFDLGEALSVDERRRRP